MKKLRFLSLCSLAILSIASISHAAQVKDLRIETTDDYVNIFWSPLSADEFGEAEGYALQFSERQTDVEINEPANLYFSRGETSISLRRNSFDNEVFYYTRVYTYDTDENGAIIKGNGSQRTRWKTNYWNNVESDKTTINDPVVVANNNTDEVDKDSLYDFGELRITAFDSFVDLTWSSPILLTDSDFDGFLVRISEKSDLSDPLFEGTLSRESTQTRIMGLNPNTQYYVGAYFYERSGGENKTFGSRDIKNFRTINAIPRDGSTAASRNLAKIEKRSHGQKLYIGGTTTTSTSNTDTTTTTSNNASSTSLLTRIANLKRQISSLQAELRSLESQAGITSSTSTPPRTTTSTSTRTTSSATSTRSRIKALLEARRNK